MRGFPVISKYSWRRTFIFSLAAIVITGCTSAPQVTRTQEIPEDVDAPYHKILVVTLFEAFDPRAYLEREVVLKLAELGTDAVASTTMMNSRTPVTRATFLAMVDEIGADAVLVTQLSSLHTKATVKDMRPESTWNIRPTYYFNVFSVELTEYTEPQGLEREHDLVLTTELYSVNQREGVWAIQSSSKYVFNHEQTRDYSIYVIEAKAIGSSLLKDKMIVGK
jgi:hypothetical protein